MFLVLPLLSYLLVPLTLVELCHLVQPKCLGRDNDDDGAADVSRQPATAGVCDIVNEGDV